FLEAHPQFDTHHVHCDFRRLRNIIPNFMGGALPRSDRGDREYYCMTMLTLFKPWRSPADLKDEISTWDQSFIEHKFTDRENELVRNFNLRYECNDARDDHYAQMKKKEAEAGRGYFPNSFLDVKDSHHDFVGGDIDVHDENEDVVLDTMIGPKTQRLNNQMDEIRRVLRSSKWLNKNTEGILPLGTTRIDPAYKTKTAWAKIVKEA
ncbi:hypothetical protein C8R46DRAFT_849940, partial [Mycena filopes]